MDDSLLHYLAGFFDGEGCVTVIRERKAVRNGEVRDYFYPAVSVAQIDRAPLRLFQQAFGGSIVVAGKAGEGVRQRDCYVWRPFRAATGDVLATLAPLLIVKRWQAELGLRLHAMGRQGRGDEDGRHARTALYDEMQTLLRA